MACPRPRVALIPGRRFLFFNGMMTRTCSFTARKMNSAPFQPGDVVRLNALGRKRVRSPPERTGVVISVSKTGQRVTLRWSGLKDTTALHWTYLERADQ